MIVVLNVDMNGMLRLLVRYEACVLSSFTHTATVWKVYCAHWHDILIIFSLPSTNLQVGFPAT